MLRPIAMLDLRQRTRGAYTARVKIPRDVAADYAAIYGQSWSVKETWRSPTEAEAREESARWANMVEARFKALRAARAGHRHKLDHREVHALVGIWYAEFVAKHEADLASPDSYEAELADLSHEVNFGGFDLAAEIKVDKWLIDHGYALIAESRAAFLDALFPIYIEALTLLAKRARGDYGRDPIAETFPTLEPAKAVVSLTALWDQWVSEKKPAYSTVRRWRGVIAAASARWPDISRVTEADARTWIKSLVTAERSAFTVAGTWRTALKTLFNWAVDEGKLGSNPFARVKIAIPRKNETRENKAFTNTEVHTILTATVRYQGKDKHRAAKRWLPWLMFYSGCRVGEAAQLRGVDINKRDDVWAITFQYTKTRKPRTVPIHSHLLEQGFIEFAQSRGAGPLFYEWQEDRAEIDDVAQNVGEWVRSLGVDDHAIRPSHAWRHLFRLRAERAGIPDRLIDVIGGWKSASVGRAYGAPLLSDLAREMAKFPRYPS